MPEPLAPDVFQTALAEARRVHFAGDFERARRLYDNILVHNPNEPGPLVMLAELDMREGRLVTARKKLEFVAQRHPEVLEVRIALASVLEELGDTSATTALYEQETRRVPEARDNWVNLAGSLQTAGRIDKAAETFRYVADTWPKAISGYFGLAAIDPALLKPADIAQIRHISVDEQAPVIERVHACFALGNALEGQQDYDGAFLAFDEGNRLRRESMAMNPIVPDWMLALPAGPASFTSVEQAERTHDDFVRETIQTFVPQYFAKFGGGGERSAAPIFIVGMPRSGSTLLEQILSSHPDVQGLGETPALSRSFRGALANIKRNPSGANPAAFYGQFGGSYLAALRELGWDGQRRPVDKMLGNYINVGLIHLALPNAVIVHSVRDPVDTCLSGYRQFFGRKNEQSFDLAAIGRQYVCYRRMMDHWDRVLPGRVIHVEHEGLIAEPEQGIRRLVSACGLSWDDVCLRYNENQRTVRTASVVQVRRPISTAAVQRWRKYEAHLGPLFGALGAYAPRQ